MSSRRGLCFGKRHAPGFGEPALSGYGQVSFLWGLMFDSYVCVFLPSTAAGPRLCLLVSGPAHFPVGAPLLLSCSVVGLAYARWLAYFPGDYLTTPVEV